MAKITVIIGTARSSRREEIDRRFAEQLGDALLLLPSRADVRRRQQSFLAQHSLPGFWGTPILDLASFAERIVAESLGPVRRVSQLERRLLLEQAVRASKDPLSALLGVDPTSLPGFATHLLAVIMQLKQAGVEPQQFVDTLSAKGELLPIDRAVAVAYAAYQALLKEAAVFDVPGLYWAAQACCEERIPALIQGKRLILLDLFDDFTPSELRLLKVVAERVPDVIFGLHHDIRPARRDAYEAPRKGLEKLREAFGQQVQTIDCPEPAPDSEAAFVAEHLFWRDTPPAASIHAPGLSIIPCIDARHEMETIAREARALLNAGVRPGDMAIAIRETGAPLTILLSALRDCAVPCNTTLGIPLASTATGAALLQFMKMLHTWERETVLDLLASPVLWGNEDAPARDAFGVLVRKAAILAGEQEWDRQLAALAASLEGTSRRGATLTERLVEPAPLLATLRQRLDTLRNWAAAFPAEASDSDYLKATQSMLADWQITPGSEADALWSTLLLLNRHVGVGRAITLGDFASLLGRAFAEVEVCLSAGKAAVLVAAPESLRNQTWKHLFVAGVNEGTYPRSPALNALYGRQDLHRLEQSGVRIEGSDVHAARERLLFLRLLLDVQGAITLTWHLKKEGDREAMPSPFLTEMEELLEARPGVRRMAPSAEDIVPQAHAVAGLRDAANLAALRGGNGAKALSSRLPAVVRGQAIEQERWREAPCGIYDGMLEEEGLLARLAGKYGSEHIFSAAQLETWLACPFQFFQDRVLHIDESTPFEGEFDPRTRGSILHGVLCHFHARHRGRPLTEVARKEATVWLNEDIQAAFAPLFQRASGLPVEAVAAEHLYLGGLLRRYLDHAYQEDANEWRPDGFEVPFGNAPAAEEQGGGSLLPEEVLPPYALLLASGERILIAGRIDRIDLSETGARARLIDYKSGKVPDASEIYGGRALQLSIYALAVQEVLHPGANCALAYYVPVGRQGWREALGFSARQKKEEWAMRDENTRAMIQAAIAGIRAGHFPPLPTGKDCFGCGSAKACRRQESRQMRKVAAI